MKSTILFACLLSSIGTLAAETLTIDQGIVRMDALSDKQVTVTGRAELHLSSPTPLQNSTVTLEGDHSLLVLTALMPSEAAEMLKNVKVGNEVFDSTKHRLSIYGNGCAIPGGSWGTPLTIYKEEQLRGESMDCRQDTYYREPKYLGKTSWDIDEQSLGDFDNAIRSFRLRRGYGATFANCGNGHGFSRCFVATDSDLIVPVMPEGLEFASFIRVFRHDWVGKKGIGNVNLPTPTRCSWYYTWSAKFASTIDHEYVPMRHNGNGGPWEKIAPQRNVSTLLGYNEPDKADQANLSVDYAISTWEKFCEFGLRLGSPAPAQVQSQWLRKFMAAADSLNYRVDFVATHMYLPNTDPTKLNKTIADECVKYYGGRTMWITEWNNGGPWCKDVWPDPEGYPHDADFNITRTDTIIKRPHTQANSDKMCQWIGPALQGFEDNPYMERHAFFNWSEDARHMVLDGRITPAGKIFRDFKSAPSLTEAKQYVHKWKIAPPRFEGEAFGKRIRLCLYDQNGETCTKYTVYHRVDKGEWENILELSPDTDFEAYGRHIFYYTPETNGSHQFRVQAESYKGTLSIFSRQCTVNWSQSGLNCIYPNLNLSVSNKCIIAEGLPAGSWPVVTLDGRIICTLTPDNDGHAQTHALTDGIYFLLNNKIIVK